jgi:hypothetical protein
MNKNVVKGRIVHYLAADGICRAAQVSKVWSPETVNLLITKEDEMDGPHNQEWFEHSVAYSADMTPQHWHWPMECKNEPQPK